MAQEVNLRFNASLAGGANAVFKNITNGLKGMANGLKEAAKAQLAFGQKDIAKVLANTAAGLEKLSKSQKKYNKESKESKSKTEEQVQSFGKLNDALKRLGKSFDAYSRYMITSSILRGFTESLSSGIDAIIEYDQALHDLRAITLASNAETLLLGEAMVEVATNTKFSMGEVGTGMKRLAQAGFNAVEVTTMINSIAELATGSLESLETTVGLVSTAIRVFKLDVTDVNEVVDIFANAVTRSRLTIAGLATTFNYIGPIAAATGLSLKDTNAAMMLLANSGLRFSTIGTGLRRIIGGLAKPSTKFQEAIFKAGYTLADFNPNLVDFRTIIEKIPDVVKDSGDAIAMFGYRGSSVISALSTQGIEEFDRLRGSLDRTGTTSEMAAEQMKGLQNAIKNLRDRFGVLAKTMSEGGFLDAFKMVISLARSLVELLIALSGSVIGKTIISLVSLSAVITTVGVALAAFVELGVYSKLVTWIVMFTSTAGAIGGVGVAAGAATAPVVTLTGALKGLVATAWALVANPVGATLLALSAIIAGTIGWIYKKKKALKETIIENEKYSSSLETTVTKLDRFSKLLEKNGENSAETQKAGKDLRKNLENLADSYENIQDDVYGFSTRIDENTGTLLGNKEAISDLRKVLQEEYTKSVLESVAASEKLVSSANDSAIGLREHIEILENQARVLKENTERWKKFREFFNISWKTDPLDSEYVESRFLVLRKLQLEIEKGSESAKEKQKLLFSAGKELIALLEKEGTTRAELANQTEEQMMEKFLSIKNITREQGASVAAAITLLIKERNAIVQVTDAQKELNAEVKKQKDIEQAYSAIGLSVDGVSKSFEKALLQFNVFSKTGVATSYQIEEAFRSLAGEVSNVKDFEKLEFALEQLKLQGGGTSEEFKRLERIVKETVQGIRTAASDLEDSLKNKFDVIDLEEQIRISEEWERYNETRGTKEAISEKELQKRIQQIHVDSLAKKRDLAGQNLLLLNNIKNLDVVEHAKALTRKYELDEKYYKAVDSLLKPGKSGKPAKEDPQSDVEKTKYDNQIKNQILAAKTFTTALQVEFDKRDITIKEYYAKRREYVEEDALKQKEIINNRIKQVKNEYDERIAKETETGAIETLKAEREKELLKLGQEITEINEKRIQSLTKLNGEEYKAIEASKKKIEALMEQIRKEKEASELSDTTVPMEEKHRIEMEQLSRSHADKLEKLREAGANELEIEEAIALQKIELDNKVAQNAKELNEERLKRQSDFAGNMASIMENLTSSGIVQSKKAFKAYKAFAIAQAVIDTYSAATAAYKSLASIPYVGPVLGAAAAGAAIAAGLAKVATIKAQQPPSFAYGGIIPGPRRGDRADNVRINATPGEFMVDKPTVDYYGADFFTKLQQKSMPKELLRKIVGSKQPSNTSGQTGYSNGGVISTQEPIMPRFEIINKSPIPLQATNESKYNEKEKVFSIVLDGVFNDTGGFGRKLQAGLSRRG